MAPLLVTISDLEGHFGNFCVHPPQRFTSMMVRWQSSMRWRQQHSWCTLLDHSYGPADVTKIGCMEDSW